MWMCLEFSDSGNSSSDLSEYESDGDMEDSLSPSSPNKRLTDLADTPLQLKDYMSLMDRELAQTSIGESFVRHPPTQAAATDKVRQGFRRRPQGVRWVELDSQFEVSSYVQINPSCFKCRSLSSVGVPYSHFVTSLLCSVFGYSFPSQTSTSVSS